MSFNPHIAVVYTYLPLDCSANNNNHIHLKSNSKPQLTIQKPTMHQYESTV